METAHHGHLINGNTEPLSDVSYITGRLTACRTTTVYLPIK